MGKEQRHIRRKVFEAGVMRQKVNSHAEGLVNLANTMPFANVLHTYYFLL